MPRLFFYMIVLLLTFAAGLFVMRQYQNWTTPKREENADVLLLRSKEVLKLITIEGYFAELYDVKEYLGFDIWPFQKKALVRVQAKVSIGYDLESWNLQTDANTKTMSIGPLTEPQILSIDHTLDYYDLQEGFFNSFSPDDLDRISEGAKDLIRKKANESDLMEKARTQQTTTLAALETITNASGWKLAIRTGSPLLRPDALLK